MTPLIWTSIGVGVLALAVLYTHRIWDTWRRLRSVTKTIDSILSVFQQFVPCHRCGALSQRARCSQHEAHEGPAVWACVFCEARVRQLTRRVLRKAEGR